MTARRPIAAAAAVAILVQACAAVPGLDALSCPVYGDDSAECAIQRAYASAPKPPATDEHVAIGVLGMLAVIALQAAIGGGATPAFANPAPVR